MCILRIQSHRPYFGMVSKCFQLRGFSRVTPLAPCCSVSLFTNWFPACLRNSLFFYLDDGTLGGNFEDIQADLHRMGVEGEALGLHLNAAKSDLIAHSFSTFSNHPTFAGLQHVHSPLGIEALDTCLEAHHLRQLHLVGERLEICHLQTQDAMIILRHTFAIP